MCGIVGWMGGGSGRDVTSAMLASLTHRGPDSSGEWRDDLGNIWLGHRRLAVVDLSEEGHQPMVSPSGQFILTYNGEVYNYRELKRELLTLGFHFKGTSDTEVLLAAFEAWGVQVAVERFIGMFVFGVYDRNESCLWLVRDRFGIKPLYYAQHKDEMVFASELHTLRRVRWLDDRIDPDALHAYLRFLCVPAPATIIRGARKLLPGSMLRWDGVEAKQFPYWSLEQCARKGLDQTLSSSFEEAADELEVRLKDAVRLRMRSDVPYGAFLSGGIDSSLVAAVMQAEASKPIKTFSIGFSEPSHDESPYARAVAHHLGTEHNELILQAGSIPDLIPDITMLHDEPFADGSSVPTYLLSRFAREKVTVALSGDGGDELFGGYPRYFWAERIQAVQRLLGCNGARWVGKGLASLPAGLWGKLGTVLGGGYSGAHSLSDRVHRLANYLACPPEQVYEKIISAWKNPADVLGYEMTSRLGPGLSDMQNLRWSEQMMLTDQQHYLPDDILTKVDRASMAVSLEVRVPLLDHRLLEWSWRLPLQFKLSGRGDQGKLLLREVLGRYVPKELFERPKMGFGMPMGKWLRRELRDWAEEMLSPGSLASSSLLDVDCIRTVWREHLAGQDRLPQLWTILMFQQWYHSRYSKTPALCVE